MYKVPGFYIENNFFYNDSDAFCFNYVTAFIGITEKGPVNKAVRIKSFNQFIEVFGSFTDYSYLPYSVYGYFNCGGTECIIVRIVHEENSNITGLTSKITVNGINNNEMLIIEALSCGSWGNNISVNLRYSNNISLINGKIKDVKLNEIKINLTVKYKDKIENYINLSADPDNDCYFIKLINSRSKLVRINALKDEMLLPEEIFNKYLCRGSNGLIDLSPDDFTGCAGDFNNNTGLRIIENLDDVLLIVLPDALIFYNNMTDKDKAIELINKVYKSAIEICEIKNDKVVILDFPAVDDLNVLLNNIKNYDSKNACLFYPHLEVLNPSDGKNKSLLEIPCSGHAAGLISGYINNVKYNDSFSNKFLNYAAGIFKRLNGYDLKMLYESGINTLKYIPAGGVKLWGLRTLSKENSFKYITDTVNIIKIKKALVKGLQWILFENNSSSLRKNIKRDLVPFFQDLWLKGILSGSNPKEAFYIICDETNNTNEDYQNGKINIEIGIALTKPAEFIVVNIKSDNGNIDIFDS